MPGKEKVLIEQTVNGTSCPFCLNKVGKAHEKWCEPKVSVVDPEQRVRFLKLGTESRELYLQAQRLRQQQQEMGRQVTGLGTAVVGTWDCPLCPFGICVYDNAEDPCHDDCFFCHQPSERK